MGMFDQTDLGKPFSENFKDNEAFMLESIEVGPLLNTSFGESRIVILTIEGERYSVFGQGLLNQAREMDAGDLPARVVMARISTKTPGQFLKQLQLAGDVSAATGDDIPF